MSLLRGRDVDAFAPHSLGHQAWEIILSDAAKHGLTPILYRWLKESGSDRKLPLPAIDRIKADVFRLAARNITFAQEAASILRAFEASRLACAPVRGLTLAELLYGDITARPMGDLDLLVRKDDLQAVTETLRELGFQAMDRRPGFAQTYSNALEFVKNQHGWVIVEPHWTIAYPPFTDRIDMDAVWKRCARGKALGVDTWLLGRTDLLLHLCFHLIHRGESAPLLWFYELDRLIRREQTEIEWDQVVRVANESGLGFFASEALRMIKESFDSPVADQVFVQLQEDSTSHLSRSFGRSVEHRVISLLAGDSRADGRESLALFFTIKGLRAKARYALALLFPSAEFMRLHYGLSNGRQLGFCYLARVTRFAWEGLKGIGSMLAPSQTIR